MKKKDPRNNKTPDPNHLPRWVALEDRKDHKGVLLPGNPEYHREGRAAGHCETGEGEVAVTLQCCHCLDGESKILTPDGVMDISDVRPGMRVAEAAGDFTPVDAISQRQVSKVYKIKARGGGEPVLASGEHPFLCLKAEYNMPRDEFEVLDGPFWADAKDLQKGDWIATRAPWQEGPRGSLCGVEADEDVARFVGLFLAEGYVGRDCLNFAFHRDEHEYHAFVERIAKERWGANCSFDRRKSAKTTVVKVNSGKLDHEFESLFGRGAANKRIPYNMMLWGPELQASLMQGLYEGDGHVEKARPRKSLKTTSPHLAYQSAAILLRLGYNPAVNSAPASVRDGITRQKSYSVSYSFYPEGRKKVARHIDKDGWRWLKVMSVECIEGQRAVFNLKTGSESFTANGFVTHNCGMHWIPITGSGRKRGWCMACNGPVCGAKACIENHIPWEKKLDIREGLVHKSRVLSGPTSFSQPDSSSSAQPSHGSPSTDSAKLLDSNGNPSGTDSVSGVPENGDQLAPESADGGDGVGAEGGGGQPA